jgi:hypothetical protein
MMQFLIQELPVLLMLAMLAYAGIAWWFKQVSRYRTTAFAVVLFALWYGFNVVQYLAGSTFSDLAIRTSGSSFCYLVRIEACTSRRAEEERKQARQTQDPSSTLDSKVAERVNAELDRRAKADAAQKSKADTNREASVVASPNAANAGTIELPPITVPAPSRTAPAPSRTVAASSVGTRFALTDGIHRLTPAINFTTTMYVAWGSVTLIKDGIVELECTAGRTFRVFTRGWSTFELVPNSSGAVIEVAELDEGDHISKRSH